MATCPSCESSRVRNDYQPAPFLLRLVGIRALLCDYCNFQFRAFSPLPPKSKRAHNTNRKAEKNNQPSTVESKPPEIKEALTINLTPLPVSSQPPVVTDHIAPARHDLRTQVTKLHTQGKPVTLEQPHARQSAREGVEKSAHICPACGSPNVKRRHRNVLERAVLSITDHKAFVCRACQASFYAKPGEPSSKEPALSQTDPVAINSSPFITDGLRQERKR